MILLAQPGAGAGRSRRLRGGRVIAALDAAVEAATGEQEVHGIGYCIGGTALSLAMGWLAARRQKQRVT